MRYLLLFLLSFNISASYPEFRYGDTVKLLTGGSKNHWFYKCPKVGKIVGYEWKILTSYVYRVQFTCDDYTVESEHLGKYLEKYTIKP